MSWFRARRIWALLSDAGRTRSKNVWRDMTDEGRDDDDLLISSSLLRTYLSYYEYH